MVRPITQSIQTMGDARAAVARLAAEFHIPVPPVVQGSGSGSRAYWRAGIVTKLSLSPNDWHGLEVATLHEFAHALRFHQVGKHGHEYGFYTALKAVIQAWSGDLKAYPWHQEYWTLWTFAGREGLTTKPHHRAERREALALAANSPARVCAPTVRVRVGARVCWKSTHHGGVDLVGVVRSAYAGCRARVQVADGRQFYVPQSWLRPEGA